MRSELFSDRLSVGNPDADMSVVLLGTCMHNSSRRFTKPPLLRIGIIHVSPSCISMTTCMRTAADRFVRRRHGQQKEAATFSMLPPDFERRLPEMGSGVRSLDDLQHACCTIVLSLLQIPGRYSMLCFLVTANKIW